MCFLLVYVSSKVSTGRYRLILASNRDEYFTRPALPAHFWDKNSDILGGMDMTPGKEGGTWLAASKLGKVGVLLNASNARSDPQKQGRGFVINDYLSTPDSTANHLKQLQINSSLYNPFHLVSIDLRDQDVQLRHFCNVNSKVTTFGDGCHAFCNNSHDQPYLKATAGQKQLEDIVERLGKTQDKEELVSALVGVLRSDHRYYPDPVIDSLVSIPPDMRAPLSAICVRPASVLYGTRTHTVLLVDHDSNLDFYEWTLKVPIENGVFEWIQSHHQLKIFIP